jgi:queuine/archaeosine tRNA-ribosyltransferase
MRTAAQVSRQSNVQLLPSGTIVAVHNLRNRFFLPDYGLSDVPLMISILDIKSRPYLQRAVSGAGLKAYLGVQGPVMIDSGGFTLMARDQVANEVDQLIALYGRIDADMFASLDLPPVRGDDARCRASKWRTTLRHLDRMLANLGERRIMPIVHGHTLEEIAGACRDVRRRIDQPSMIALGGMVPFLRGWMSRTHFSYRRIDGSLGSSRTFVADALAICREQFPRSSVHVFGAGSPTTAIALLGLGADSVDSLAWRRAAGYGTIFLAGCAERIVSKQPRIRASRPPLSELYQPSQ